MDAIKIIIINKYKFKDATSKKIDENIINIT